MRRVFLGVLGALAMPATLVAQEVHGRVVQSGSLDPLPNVSIRLLDSAGADLKSVTTSDGKGMFWMAARDPGKYRLRVSRIGYAPQVSPVFALSAASAISMTMELFPNPQMLPELTIVADSEKRVSPLYYQRRLLGLGRVITASQIADRQLTTLLDILRQTPGVMISTYGPYSLVRLSAARLRGGRNLEEPEVVAQRTGKELAALQFEFNNNCPVAWYLNRTLVSSSSDYGPMKSISIVTMPALGIKAVEVFTRANEVPSEFRDRGTSCGAIVVWTRTPD